MPLDDETLAAYYEVRARAEQRAAESGETASIRRDALRDDVETRNREIYRERLGRLGDLDVGEVGIGAGDFVDHALAQGVRALVLIDISRERLNALGEELRTRSGAVETRLIVASAQCMDAIHDNELDLLVAKEVIEHLRDYRPFLKECHRVLRPGGRLYLTTPNRHAIDLWPRNVMAHLAPRAKRQGPALVREIFGGLCQHLTPQEVQTLGEILPPGFKEHIHEFTPGELVRCLNEHGLQTQRVWGTPPQMFFHELRPAARLLLPAWNRAERLSYVLGDDLRVIAVRVG